MILCGHTPREQIEVRPDDKYPIVLPGPVRTDPAEVDGPVDVVFLAVKDTQNEQAGGWLARLCDEHTVVGALQNGVEQVERWCGSRRRHDRKGGSDFAPMCAWSSRQLTPARTLPIYSVRPE